MIESFGMFIHVFKEPKQMEFEKNLAFYGAGEIASLNLIFPY